MGGFVVKLKTQIRRLKRNVNKVKNGYFSKAKYLQFVEEYDVVDKTIFLESKHGEGVGGNIYYLLKELCNNPKYKEYKVFLGVVKDSEKKIRELLSINDIVNVTLVKLHSTLYYKLMATTKYLINDTSFLPFFIKREEQIYLNTWHGTPLKTLGKKVKNDFLGIGNVQKNFVVADYLLYPNEYMMEHMSEDYMINELTEAKAVISGYPRNSIFLNGKRELEIKRECKIEGKEIFAYMPTWRGAVGKEEREQQVEEITGYLNEIDEKLSDNQILYVNLHPFVKQEINLKKFQKIKSFPKQYETYEFLGVCDCLITDYSSVFYDYAITGKKIILFTYDKEEYFSERGVYVSLDELPFPQTDNVQELLQETNRKKEYDDSEFLKEYCVYECANASEKLLDLILFNVSEDIKVVDFPRNGKQNVLIYAGNMAKNGITTSLMSLLEHIDLEKRNYYITFSARSVAPYKEILKQLPERVSYIPTMGIMNANLKDKKILKNYRKDKISLDVAMKRLEVVYDYERKRCYGGVRFSDVIHFTGYEFKKQILYSRFKEANKVIYVHSDMEQEIKVRKNQHIATLKYAYQNYDKIAIVTKDMLEPTRVFCSDVEKMEVANNLFDYKSVVKKAQKELKFDENTVCDIEVEELEEVLNLEGTKFITVGRFSPEKGHERLISAFNKFWKDNQSSFLIIIGGHGLGIPKDGRIC